MSLPAVLDGEVGRVLLARQAGEIDLSPDVLVELARAADAHAGKLRRKGMFQAFDAILDRSGR